MTDRPFSCKLERGMKKEWKVIKNEKEVRVSHTPLFPLLHVCFSQENLHHKRFLPFDERKMTHAVCRVHIGF